MSSISRTRNPLIHSGTSQYERLLQTLTPSYFKIDDRSIKDLLHATYQYAECLHYYDESNQKRGHWQCFWKVEMLTFLAHLSTIDVEAILQGYEDIKETHRQLDTSELDPEERQAKNNEYLLSLIKHLHELALRIEEMVLYLPDELPLKQEIIALIEKDTLTDTEQLASELARLVQFHKEAYKQVHDTRLPASEYEAFFKPYWGIPDRIFFDIELDADSSYQSNEQEDLEQLLKKIEQTFRKIKMRANYWFDLNIDTPQLRQPHVALFLAFLRLFDHARNSLNNLTKKHLEFYYEKILCLDTRAAVPDDAHLILELAATVDQHLIKEGTQFVAGKDENGKPLLFQTLENWFLNRTQVKNIKTTYLDICGVFRDENGNQTKKIYATNDVKTAYKAGEEQPNESKDCWRSMGDDSDLPDGEIGFAIASPQLILREGIRVLDIVIQLDQDLSSFNNVCINNDAGEEECIYTDYFELYLSSSEEWLEVERDSVIDFDEDRENNFRRGLEAASFNSRFIQTNGINRLEFKVILEKDHLPIDVLGEDLNEEDGYDSRWPVAKILIRKDADRPAAELFQEFRAARIEQIDLDVDVREIQENLIVQSDQGVFDGTQKFYPFGPVPEVGDHFYIGSTEIFQKALKELQVCFDWGNPPLEGFNEYYSAYGADLPYPFLKVAFIDRANANTPVQIVRQGNYAASGGRITGSITDVQGEFPIDVKLRVNGVERTDFNYNSGNGNYFVGHIAQDAVLEFYSTDTENSILKFQPLRLTLNEDGGEFYYSIFNLILFPNRLIESEDFDDPETITGKVLNILNNEGTDVINRIGQVQDDTNFTETFESDGSYELADIESTDTLRFFYEEGVYLEIPVEGYPTIGLKAFEVAPTVNRNTNSITTISGNVEDSDAEALEPEDLEGVIVRYLVNGNEVAKTVTNENGKFDLGSFSADGVLQLSYGNALPLNIEITENTEFTISYFPRQVERKIKVEGDLENIDALNQISIKAKRGNNELNNLIITNTPQSDYTLANIPTGIVLDGHDPTDSLMPITIEFSHQIEGIPLAITQELIGNRTINLRFLDTLIDKTIPTERTPTANELIGVVALPDATRLANYTIALIVDRTDDNGALTRETIDGVLYSNNIYGIIFEDGDIPIELNINHTDDFETISINQTRLQLQLATGGEVLNVQIGNPAIVSSNNSNNLLRGTVTDIKGDAIEGVKVNINNSRFPSTTASDGTYSIRNQGADSVLSFSHGGYKTLRVKPREGGSTIDAVLIQNQVFSIVKANVKDIQKQPLTDVLVARDDVDFSLSNDFSTSEAGTYQLYIPRGTDRLSFNKLGGFDTLTLVTGTPVTDSEENSPIGKFGCLDIVLYTKELNNFSIIGESQEIVSKYDININALVLERDIRTQNFTQYSPTLKRGFIRLTLDKGDFLHDEYQNVLIRATTKLADNPDRTDVTLPNPPYTPATNSIRLNYTSCQTITGEDNENIDDYFHLYPCKGYAERPLQKVEDDGTIAVPDLKLLPQYANPTFNPEDPTEIANGNLYIGLENLTPSSNLSLLIQIKEGSEQNPDVEVPAIAWSYLAKDNEWKPLSQSKILTDTTNGLKKTGIFQLTTPSDMSNETTLFEGNCHWLRASMVEKAVKDDSEPTLPDNCNETADERAATQLAIGLPSIIDIRAQAIQVQFLNQENDLSHLAQSLPDGTIQQLLISQSAVKAIEQPFPSFNGRLAEAGDAFYVRVSERLRHRDRAVTIYDYERLLLERFPKIQRAKCLNHTKPGSIDVLENSDEQLIDIELAPGYVTVAVIPRFSGHTGEAATEPRFSKGDLVDMERYLRTKTNLFVANQDRLGADYLRVVNPIYEEVRLCFAVQFKAGEAPENRRFDLDRALKGFLSPWLFDNEFDIPFGKPLNRSNLIHFIENQSYVDAIADFKMIHCGVEVTGNEIVPTNSRSILTSVIDEEDNPNSTDHTIHPVNDICDETELAELNCEN